MTIPHSILFVCLGNICRSPSAQAIMATLTPSCIFLDSAGTSTHHIGEPPDKRAIAVGKQFGVDLSPLRARQLGVQDFYDFDVIFAMDKQNLADIQKLAPKDATAAIRLFDEFDQANVADPYYGDIGDFEQMFKHIHSVSKRWLALWQG